MPACLVLSAILLRFLPTPNMTLAYHPANRTTEVNLLGDRNNSPTSLAPIGDQIDAVFQVDAKFGRVSRVYLRSIR